MKSDALLAELEKIRQAEGGILRPESVVSVAAKSAHPLHAHFEWDDSKAGHEYRLWQARQLIRVQVTMVGKVAEPVRAYVSFRDDRTQSGGGYTALVDVLSDPERHRQMIREALDDMQRFARKYEMIKELHPIIAAAARVRRTHRRAQSAKPAGRTGRKRQKPVKRATAGRKGATAGKSRRASRKTAAAAAG